MFPAPLLKVREIAIGLGLDQAELDKKMRNPALQSKIRRDAREGAQAGVRGTPAIFISGRKLRDPSLNGFQTAIDKELQKLSKQAAK
jgi:protein-disulfide isomerase